MVHLYCNREEITVPLSIAKCYHHSKVLLCGYRYCYRHCTGTVYTGTGTVPVLYRYAYGGILYWYRYYDAVPVCLYGYTSNCMWLPVLPPPTHRVHLYCNRELYALAARELYALAARELYGQRLGHQQVQRARLPVHIGMCSIRKRAHDALPILLCTCTHYR